MNCLFTAFRPTGEVAWAALISENEATAYLIDYSQRGFRCTLEKLEVIATS